MTLMPDRWFSEVDPRTDIGAIRRALVARVAAGVDSEAVVRELAQRDRVAVGELFLGPKAQPDPAMLALALAVIDVLERTLSPAPLYGRLHDLALDSARSVLAVAVERHPDAAWLVSLSSRVEGPDCGLTHLMAVHTRASFIDTCRAYAQAGARRGLVQVAVSTRRPAPFIALAETRDERALILATTHLLLVDEPPPVVAWLAATWGPDPTRILVAVLNILHNRAPERTPRLLERCGRWPRVVATARGLRASRPGPTSG